MNNFPAGTRVFYWNGAGQAVYGVVQRIARAADGSIVVEIRLEGTGQVITLPASSVTKV
ncbi:hypothetical protein DFH07DRAFT_971350 [Mycena maculata]|uniref:Uncharacterized protein n=1 Tax=Mycena maculata TaxID=230809 RepID=A0AAD7HME8_9AGAR|nr:hypothetical protein DFH07DRAFT_971350 [Mycena maculata]